MRLTTPPLLLLSTLGTQTFAFLNPDTEQHPLAHHQHDNVLNGLDRVASDDDVPSYRVPLLSLHRALVDVPSISGTENDAAFLLGQALTELNYTVSLQPLPSTSTTENPNPQPRYNVLAWPGRDARRTLHNRTLITSHIDVVPPYLPYALDHTPIPPSHPVNFTTLPATTLVSGRGSVDAKASVAAQITATTLLLTSNTIPPESIVLLYVVGEETSGDGMKHFSQTLTTGHPPSDDAPANPTPQFHAAVFGEPTDNRLACGHKGITTGTLTATGRAGHSGYPWLGRSATAGLVHALEALLAADLGSSERYGNTTVNVGVLEGGVAANVIAAEASARLAVRIAVGERRTGRGVVEGRMRDVLAGVEGGEGLGLELTGGYGPVECRCEVEGFETMVANYGTDVPNLEGEHVSYLYGPGSILVEHGDDEGLTIGDLEESVEGYKRLIKYAVEAS
ncbi:uncharacterized protein B0H64DRAFT_445944 [Chaetomium fimeti]|uniref:Peptidase M20 dimerisation domain-containing protein n=1 Tax=Chaetomium fimeti TaxID=1854472 RepID=A0AAE0LP90_9PEZI|nr:hypothetical protein B0H64DRAFT_445944 [Chaetomium fimeti]